MRIAVGSDHAGFPLKAPVLDALRSWGHEVDILETARDYVDRFLPTKPEEAIATVER